MNAVSDISEREQSIEKKKTVMRKKRRKARVKKRLIVFVFVFLCAGIILTVLKAPFFNISKIECTGQKTLTSEQILATAGIKTGANIFSVNVESAKRKIAAIPAISEANVRRIFPNKIKIWVKECEEAAYISLNGTIAIIDSGGKIIRTTADDAKLRASMAEILGITAVSDKPGERISAENDIVAKQAYECIGILTELGLLEKVKQIDLTDMSDFKIKYDNRLEIYLGGYENMEYKIRFVGKVIKENISEYEKAKLDYRGDKLYVGALEDETVTQPEDEEPLGDTEGEDMTKQLEKDGEAASEEPEQTDEDADNVQEVQ